MRVTFTFLLLAFILGVILFVGSKPKFNLPQLPAPQSKKVSLLMTGDVMLGRTVMTTSLDKNDPTYPFTLVADKLREADITFINLENPIVTNCPKRIDGMIFCADPKMMKGLTYAGVDIVNLANNHTLNHGRDGFEETKKYLDEAGISYTGDNNLVIKEINGTKFGFLGFEKSQLGNPKITTAEVDLITQSDPQVDVLVVAMHWGVEYQDKGSIGQRNLAREVVELGADVIVGHHPHWVQDSELFNNKPVYYSLGNFVFDQMWSQKTREGKVVNFNFENDKVMRVDEMKVYMEEWARPKWVKQECSGNCAMSTP